MANNDPKLWSVRLRNLVRLAQDRQEEVAHRFILSVCTAIIEKSPVDTGRFRSNWNFSLNEPNYETTESTRKRPLQSVEMKLAANKGKVTRAFFVNALPYAAVLEYGQYPNPPKNGTWNKKTKEYEIRSTGGFSKQAPTGIVRTTVMEIRPILEAAAEEVRRGG